VDKRHAAKPQPHQTWLERTRNALLEQKVA
jgi:hypothetical protein